MCCTYLFVQEVLVVELHCVHFLYHVFLEVSVDVEDVLGDVPVGGLHVHNELGGCHDCLLVQVFRAFECLFLLLFDDWLADTL